MMHQVEKAQKPPTPLFFVQLGLSVSGIYGESCFQVKLKHSPASLRDAALHRTDKFLYLR